MEMLDNNTRNLWWDEDIDIILISLQEDAKKQMWPGSKKYSTDISNCQGKNWSYVKL